MKKATSPSTRPRRELALLLALALLALAVSVLMTAGRPAAAGPLHQDSPVSPVDSPLPTPSDGPVLPTPQPDETPGTMRPPIPVPVLAGIMLAIGAVALVVGVRRG